MKMMFFWNQERAQLSIAFLGVALRALTSGSKFLLFFILAYYLEPAELGTWGLFVAAVLVGGYAVGAGYSFFVIREVLRVPTEERGALIAEQGRVYLATYVVAMLLGLLPWFFWQKTPQAYYWLWPILIVDHLSLEGYHLLIALSRPVLANTVIFLRNGCWGILVALGMVLGPGLRNLNFVWAIWLFWSSAAVLLGAWGIRREIPAKNIRVNWQRIRQGLRIALPLLMATLLTQGIFSIDRYFLDFYHAREIVGVYTFFIGMANFIYVVVDAGVVTIQYPALLSAFHLPDKALYREKSRRYWRSMVAATLVAVMLLAIGIYPMLLLIGRSIYIAQIAVFGVLCAAFALYALSLIPHYHLYAAGLDRPIMFSTVAAALVALLLNIFLAPTGAMGVAVAVLGALATLLSAKAIFWLRSVNNCPGEEQVGEGEAGYGVASPS